MDWPKVKIGDLVESISRWNPKDNPAAPSFTYIDLSSIDKEKKLIHEVTIVHPNEAPSRARQLVHENDVLVSTVRPNLNGVAMVGPEYDGATASTGYCVLRPNPEKILPSFLFHWVKTPHFISEMTRNSTGANYPAVSDKTVKEHLISLPPIDEQKRIAAILDVADEIKSSSKSAKEIRKQIIRNSYLDLFGDPLDPENNAVKLSEIATITMGQSPPGTSYNDEGEGIPLLNGPAEFGEQHPVEVQWTNLPKKLCQPGDILICVRGATAGRLNVADKEYCLGRGLAAIRPIANNDISADFIIESLHFYYDYFHEKGTGSTFININKEMLSELIIPLAEKTNIQLYSKLKKNLSTGTGETIQNTHLLVNSLVQEILS
jgi:type I restriction enzyme, S subunit